MPGSQEPKGGEVEAPATFDSHTHPERAAALDAWTRKYSKQPVASYSKGYRALSAFTTFFQGWAARGESAALAAPRATDDRERCARVCEDEKRSEQSAAQYAGDFGARKHIYAQDVLDRAAAAIRALPPSPSSSCEPRAVKCPTCESADRNSRAPDPARLGALGGVWCRDAWHDEPRAVCPTCGSMEARVRLSSTPHGSALACGLCDDPWHDEPRAGGVEALLFDAFMLGVENGGDSGTFDHDHAKIRASQRATFDSWMKRNRARPPSRDGGGAKGGARC